MLQGTLDASGFGGGELIPASAAGLMYAASPPSGDEPPTVNGGHSDSYSESMNREPAPEPAEEVSENGPLLGWLAGLGCFSFKALKQSEKTQESPHWASVWFIHPEPNNPLAADSKKIKKDRLMDRWVCKNEFILYIICETAKKEKVSV